MASPRRLGHGRLASTGGFRVEGGEGLEGFSVLVFNIGALIIIIRIGFGGPVYYNYNKEPPK